ncbi:hypothetical protein EI94DRAFT_1924338 [Lactarius quietus]|nr:hypothetical protein EI94DRAFT_1924338 [Lactarius quietus]
MSSRRKWRIISESLNVYSGVACWERRSSQRLARWQARRGSGLPRTSWKKTKNLSRRTIRTRVQQFLFKAIRNTPMVGEVWFRIQNFEQRGVCRGCNATKSMDHILIGCTLVTTNTVWRLAKGLWNYERYRWPATSMGIILGCGNLVAMPLVNVGCRKTGATEKNKHERNRGNQATTNPDIGSRSPTVIWVLRCERVIQEKARSTTETEARWYKAINRRLTEDKIVATKIKRDKEYQAHRSHLGRPPCQILGSATTLDPKS